MALSIFVCGLPHDIERILGRRGSLPPGSHVLCPLNTDLARKLESFEKKKTRLENQLKKKQAELNDFSNKKCKAAIECHEGMIQLRKEIADTSKGIEEIREKEIVIKNGWFFFAEPKVKSVLKRVNEVSEGKSKPDNYVNVCKTLIGPEEYLGQLQVFSKK